MVALDAPTVQAWSAVAIAGLTAALVLVTIAYVKQTARIAKYTEATARSAERSLLLESMPIVLPATGVGTRAQGGTTVHVTLTNTGRHAAINGQVRVHGQGGFALGPLSFPSLRSREEARPAFQSRGDTAPLWNEGALSEYTVSVDYQDTVGNRYRVENAYRNGTSEMHISRFRDGRWESLSAPDDVLT